MLGVLLGVVPGLAPQVQAATGPAFTLSITPAQNLVDGQSMSLTVTRTAAGTAQGLQITAVATGWCTADFQGPTGISYNSRKTHTLNQLTAPQQHCTTQTHPLNGDPLPVAGISPQYKATGTYPSVTGSVPAQSTLGTTLYTKSYSLVCDAGHPCTFVAEVFTSQAGNPQSPTFFLGVPVTYLPTSLNTSCGGAAPGQLASVGPDRLGQAVTDWTLGACAAGVAGGKAVSSNLASRDGDGSALAAFASGSADLAYSAVGYNATAGLTPSVDRPYVAVPVAVNAVVLGHVQTHAIDNPAGWTVFGDYPPLRITVAQAAQLLGGGPTPTAVHWNSKLGQALVAENPTLGEISAYYAPTAPITAKSGGISTSTGIVATSLADATTLFATSFFHTLTPSAMRSTVRGQELGVTSDFGTANPPFGVDSTSGLVATTKALTPGTGQGFALTDAATAAALWGGLAQFAVQTPGSIGSSPTYVLPTTTSMRVAVSEMIPQADGTLMPNPDGTAVDGVEPYPLTFVEYAIAPAQPLLNADCTARTTSQGDLTAWLDYLTGAGQSKLPAGLIPLTPTLQSQAQAAIARVGASPTTGTCAASPAKPASTTTTTTTSAAGPAATTSNPGSSPSSGGSASGGSGSTFPASRFSSTGGRGDGGSPPATPGSTKAGAPGGSTIRQPAIDLAGFRSAGPSWTVPVIGILLLVLLLPGLALLLSGRSPRRLLDEIAGRTKAGPPEDGS